MGRPSPEEMQGLSEKDRAMMGLNTPEQKMPTASGAGASRAEEPGLSAREIRAERRMDKLVKNIVDVWHDPVGAEHFKRGVDDLRAIEKLAARAIRQDREERSIPWVREAEQVARHAATLRRTVESWMDEAADGVGAPSKNELFNFGLRMERLKDEWSDAWSKEPAR